MNPSRTAEATPLISLRPLVLADADEYYDLFDRNRQHIAEHDPRLAKSTLFLSAVENMLNPNSKREHHLAVMQDDAFVGATWFKLQAQGSQAAEIGYWIDRHHIRQGIATQACRQLINYAFAETDTRYIEARIAATNTASIKTVERVGLTLDHYHEDDVVYALDARHMSR